ARPERRQELRRMHHRFDEIGITPRGLPPGDLHNRALWPSVSHRATGIQACERCGTGGNGACFGTDIVPKQLFRGLNRRDFFADETELPTDLLLDRLERRGIVFQELLDVFAPLTEPLAGERKPRPALLDDPP